MNIGAQHVGLEDGASATTHPLVRDSAEIMRLGEIISDYIRSAEKLPEIASLNRTKRIQVVSWAHEVIGKELTIPVATAKLYRRCYEKFGRNEDAICHLKLGELNMLLSASDELVAQVIDAKKADPKLGRAAVQKIILEYRLDHGGGVNAAVARSGD
ncbi:hypothetical protein WQE_19844 [Paraburkholderia hospita]|uniref:Uncharacterized protein n=1 Tax=Paraburkholderia hospita TaxID=169430 RepID=A0ABN0FKG7_9BURK|nr:hypothetical protein [Paraburkholderia hospita]EIM99285.1 hypothetical protein WQE_19844 [Paraburkholderia hospita]OUL87673.1 hypothetical protein CA602_13120 [Paraburkholderia hospita]